MFDAQTRPVKDCNWDKWVSRHISRSKPTLDAPPPLADPRFTFFRRQSGDHTTYIGNQC